MNNLAVNEVYRGIWVVAFRELLRFVCDRAGMLLCFSFPLFFLMVFGGGFSNVVGVMAAGVNLMQFMYPGIIAMTVLIGALVAGGSIASDRENGFLREVLVAPISRSGIVLGKAIGAGAVTLLQVLMLLIIAPFVGVRLVPGTVLMLAPLVVVLSLGLSGFGMVIASFVRSQQGFEMMLRPLMFLTIFLAGIFFPVDNVPVWMEILSKLNPLTYGVDAIRQIFLGSDPAASGLGVTVLGHAMTLVQDVAIVAVLCVILLIGAIRTFGREG